MVSVLEEEEATFEKTLERGLRYLDDELAKSDGTLSGEAAFFLYDSLGFPVDLTELVAGEKGYGSTLLDSRRRCRRKSSDHEPTARRKPRRL